MFHFWWFHKKSHPMSHWWGRWRFHKGTSHVSVSPPIWPCMVDLVWPKWRGPYGPISPVNTPLYELMYRYLYGSEHWSHSTYDRLCQTHNAVWNKHSWGFSLGAVHHPVQMFWWSVWPLCPLSSLLHAWPTCIIFLLLLCNLNSLHISLSVSDLQGQDACTHKRSRNTRFNISKAYIFVV